VSYWNGLLGVSGEFRTVFDNTEYSSVPLPKPDEATYFFSDLTLYADFHLAESLVVSVGGKAKYDFGSDVDGGPGPRAYLRLRGTFETPHHHWLFGNFRDSITPLTFIMRDYDNELAGMRYRLTLGPTDTRLFLSRASTVGTDRYEIFAYGGRASYQPWKVTTLGANLGGTHQGGFDAGHGSPPPGGRKREVAVGSLDLGQDIRWGFYVAGEAAVSISRSDTFEGQLRDNAYWAGLGWRKGPVEVGGRFYRVGWAFETPWGERFLRNDEGLMILDDFYAWEGFGAVGLNVWDVGRLTLGGTVGMKYKALKLGDQDYNFNIQLVKFEAAL